MAAPAAAREALAIPSPSRKELPPVASVYDQIGGSYAVSAAVDDLYERLLADGEIGGYFAGRDMRRQKAHMRAFIAVALGGPEIYRGRQMDVAHRGLGITSGTFDRVVTHLVATLATLGVPAPLIEAIGGRLAPLKVQIVTA
jgi:hemoglobin